MLKIQIKNNIRKLRFFADGMSQNELARRTNVVRQTIIAIESGKCNPSLELAFKIAKVLNVEFKEVFEYVVLEDTDEIIN
jgi:putative transcriptional regulator